MSTAERLRLHRRAVQVLQAIEQIEATLRVHPEVWFRQQPAARQVMALDDLQAIDDLTFETEARLALCPLKRGGAR